MVNERLVSEHDRLAVPASPGRDDLPLFVAGHALDPNLALHHDYMAEQHRRGKDFADGRSIPLPAARTWDTVPVHLTGYRSEPFAPDPCLDHPCSGGGVLALD